MQEAREREEELDASLESQNIVVDELRLKAKLAETLLRDTKRRFTSASLAEQEVRAETPTKKLAESLEARLRSLMVLMSSRHPRSAGEDSQVGDV